MAEKFTPGAADAGLMSLVRRRVEQGWPMAQIAAETGWEVGALCEWVLAYREPKRQRFANVAGGPAALAERRVLRETYFGPASERDQLAEQLSSNAQRFAAWRRARDGARERLDAIGADGMHAARSGRQRRPRWLKRP